MDKLLGNLFSLFLLLLISMPFYVSALPTGAATCNVQDMSSVGHGTSSLKSPAGYTLNATMQSQGKFNFALTGPGGGIEGLLVYVLDSNNNRVGQFSNLPAHMQFKTDCPGQMATITHTDKTLKNFPINLNWNSPQGSSGQLTIKSLVVKDFSDWAQLDDVSFDPVSGTASAAPSSTTSSSTSSNDSGTQNTTSVGGFLQTYSLFIVMIGITTLLYIVGSVTEAMLKRQQVKARSFAKTIQNGFGDSR